MHTHFVQRRLIRKPRLVLFSMGLLNRSMYQSGYFIWGKKKKAQQFQCVLNCNTKEVSIQTPTLSFFKIYRTAKSTLHGKKIYTRYIQETYSVLFKTLYNISEKKNINVNKITYNIFNLVSKCYQREGWHHDRWAEQRVALPYLHTTTPV